MRLDDLFDDLSLLNQKCTYNAGEKADQRGSRRARIGTHRDLTQSPHRLPPYARFTVFCRFEIVAYCLGRSAGSYFESISALNSLAIPNLLRKDTYARQSDAAITAFWSSSLLLQVMIDELAARSLDLASSIRFGVIRLAFSERDSLGHLELFYQNKRSEIDVSDEIDSWRECRQSGMGSSLVEAANSLDV